jgi:hypothetical protein
VPISGKHQAQRIDVKDHRSGPSQGKFDERPSIEAVEQDGPELADQRIARIGARALIVEGIDRNAHPAWPGSRPR